MSDSNNAKQWQVHATESTLVERLILRGKRVVVLGLARQGLALARFLTGAGAQVTVSDRALAEERRDERQALDALGVRHVLGGHPLSLLDECDLLCLSGGVPPQLEIVQAAIARGIPLSNDSLLTLQAIRVLDLGPVVAITGSSGKTTSTTLVGEMVAASGQTVHVGGNIGTPLVDRLASIQPGEPIVMELSSFQLELFDAATAYGDLEGIGPDLFALLNVTPNHLDRHGTMHAYAAAKLNGLRWLPTGAIVVLNADDPVTSRLLPTADQRTDAPPTEWELTDLLAAIHARLTELDVQSVPFSRQGLLSHGAWLAESQLLSQGEPFCRAAELKLRGDHNVSNMLAAAAISHALNVPISAIGHTATNFAGVPHRLEIVAQVDDVTWINDSIATSPERAIAALRSFDPTRQTLILLAGGKDKKLPWERFAEEAIDRVSMLIGFGDAGAMIIRTVQDQAELNRTNAPSCAVVQRLDEAVDLARRAAAPGTVVLLSPGGTSYDAYRDFEERGEHFRRLVYTRATDRPAPFTKKAGAGEQNPTETPDDEVPTGRSLDAANRAPGSTTRCTVRKNPEEGETSQSDIKFPARKQQ